MADEKSPIINALIKIDGDITQPLSKLVDTIGSHFEPQRTRRMADANKYKAIKEAETAVEVEKVFVAAGIDIAAGKRVLSRLIQRELRREENWRAIIDVAVNELKELPAEAVSDEPVDVDWTAQLFEASQDVSNEDMQSLWGRILAGEVVKPGSFSLRTLQLVRVLRRSDAELFTSLCRFAWLWTRCFYTRETTDIFKAEGINHHNLLHLSSIGLIAPTFTTTVIRLDPKESFVFGYFNNLFKISFPEGKGITIDGKRNQLRYYPLTQIGYELAPISGAEPHEEYLNCLIQVWRNAGLSVEQIDGDEIDDIIESWKDT